MSLLVRSFIRVCAAAALAAAALSAPAQAQPGFTLVQQISADPFAAATTIDQHATEVEPDTFASGQTVVAAFQTGRFFDGGATAVGYSVSHDGGASWPT